MSEVLYSCVVEPDNLALIEGAVVRSLAFLLLMGVILSGWWHACDGFKRAVLERQK